MEYTHGMKVFWLRDGQKKPEVVTVTLVKARGWAKLSNGWTVDEDGFAEGTSRVAGGRAYPILEKDGTAPVTEIQRQA
jgi:hypothetical protein